MQPKQMKSVASNEIAKLAEIKECKGHEWEGPSQEVQWGDGIKHLYHCMYCPLAKLFDETKER